MGGLLVGLGGYLDLGPMVYGYWLVMGNDMTWIPMICCIAYLAMDCDIMFHMRNAMWIHWFICWTCKC